MNRPDRPLKTVGALSLLPFTALLISGCAVDQKKEVATYRQVIDGNHPPDVGYKPGDPLSLEAALLLANKNDEQLASGGEDYLQAEIDKERQFSTFLPTISLAPTYTFVDHRASGSVNSSGVITNSSFSKGFIDVPAQGSYRIFNGFQDIANLRRAGHTAEQRKALLLDLQQTTLLNVAQTYYAVLTFERSVTVLLNSVDVQNERVRDMEGRQRAGVARPLDVAQTQAQAAATRVQLIQAQNNARTSRIALAFLAGAAVQDAPLSDRLRVPYILLSQDELVKIAERTRQDVQAGQAAIEAARQSLQAAIGQYYPSVTLNVSYFFHKEAGSTLWEGLFSGNIPIFTAGIVDANVRTAWSQLRQAWLADQRNRRTVSEQVRTAYENLAGSKLRIVDLRIEVSAARDALQQARFSYNAGLATNLDVLTAQDQLLSAQLALATERLNFKLFYIQLLRSEGRLPLPISPEASANVPTSEPSDEELTTPGLSQGPGMVPGANPATNPATAPTTQPVTP